MKIIIPTIGTRGDVQPYIALALGLRKAGHSVTLATHPCMRGLDLAVIVPMTVLTGILLLQRIPHGYLLATPLLVLISLMGEVVLAQR